MTDPTLEDINSLNAEELVKDIFRGWIFVRENYTKEIQKFQFSNQTKTVLTQLAQKMYEKYANQQNSSQSRVVLDKGVLKEFWSNLIYGNEPYPLFSYPYSILMADSLSPDIFCRIFQNKFAKYIDFELFARIYWQEKHNCISKFSDVDLKLLKELFSGIDTRSSIGFPNVIEIWNPSMNFSESTARVHYRRLLNLDTLVRLSIINYSKLGLIPLLKIYSPRELCSDTELNFTTLESVLTPNQSFRLLAIPERSSFWTRHSANDVKILQSRESGVNFNLFDGKKWKMDFLTHLIDLLPKKENIPTPQWRMFFSPVSQFSFRLSDLRLLVELKYSPERQIKHLGLRANVHPKYVSNRLKELQNAGIFQTQFLVYNVGLNERYNLLALGKKSELKMIYQFVCHQPQYYVVKAQECMYAMVWLPPKEQSMFLDGCSSLQEKIELKEFYYGQINHKTKVHVPNLPKLWIKKRKSWYSEPQEY
ncbi:MAG: hypothetical protein ACFFCZ_25275 [Promethearchaeota archaeon]